MKLKKRCILAVLVRNEYGVVTRISGLFTRRGFNIDSFTGEETEDPRISRLTIVAKGDERELEQIKKQLEKLEDVIKVKELKPEFSISRELALIKVRSDAANRSDIIQIVNIFRAKIVDVNSRSLVIEITGEKRKIKAMLRLLKPFGIIEIVRTGLIALQRGNAGIIPSKLRGSVSRSKEEV
ncbi:MAG: acetolactate synthase small subunit [Firmicutes bacterium]|nr:acetolactate synthase small subunit [Bacillota bacterium]